MRGENAVTEWCMRQSATLKDRVC